MSITLFDKVDPIVEIDTWVRPHIGEQWHDLLDKNVLYSAARILKTVAEKGDEVYPSDASLVLRAFRETSPEDMRVFLLSKCPYPDNNADGLTFSCARTAAPSLRQVYYSLTDDNQVVDDKSRFDYPIGLEHWAAQGVLLLNTKLQVKAGDPNSYSSIGWQEFVSHVIERCSNKMQRTIFALIGNEAKNMKKYINPLCPILEDNHPAFAAKNGAYWSSTIFKDINDIFEKRGQNPIYWLMTESEKETFMKEYQDGQMHRV